MKYSSYIITFQRTSVVGISAAGSSVAGDSSASQGHETKSAGRHAAADKVWTDVDVNKVAVDVAV